MILKVYSNLDDSVILCRGVLEGQNIPSPGVGRGMAASPPKELAVSSSVCSAGLGRGRQ